MRSIQVSPAKLLRPLLSHCYLANPLRNHVFMSFEAQVFGKAETRGLSIAFIVKLAIYLLSSFLLLMYFRANQNIEIGTSFSVWMHLGALLSKI